MPAIAIIAIGAVAAFAFFFMLAFAYRNTFGALLQLIIGGIERLPALPWPIGKAVWDLLASPLKSIDHAIRHGLGLAIASSQRVWVYTLNHLAELAGFLGREVEGLALDAEREFIKLRKYTIPAAIAVALGPFAGLEYLMRKRIEHAIHVAISEATRLAHRAEHQTAATVKAIAAPWTLPRIRTAERDIEQLGKRIDRLARKTAPAALVGAFLYAIAHTSLHFIRCTNVRKVGNKLCGMNTNLLDDLLAGTTIIVGAVSIVEFAEVMLAAEEEIIAGLQAGVRELRGIEPLQFSGYSGTLG